MPEDKETATEEPTPKKIEESHSRGQFAQAQEFQVVAGLVAGYIVLLATVPSVSAQIAEFSAAVLGHMDKFEVTPEAVSSGIDAGFAFLGVILLPLLVACTISGIIAGGLQSGFKLTPKVMENGAEKLNPVSGFKRVFSFAGVMKMFVDFLKLGAVGAIVFASLHEILGDPLFYTPVPVNRLGEFIYSTATTLFLRLAVIMLVIAFIHYLYQRHKTHKDMKMTLQEVKDENKQSQGDPLVKNAMRAMARKLAMRQMLGQVPFADVVVTNPTHFAVAMKYERGVDIAPVVLAKGRNAFAQRIKKIAREHGVPMVENRPVAQALYKVGEVGKSIPPELYQAVAEILGFVYKTHKYYFHQLKARRLSAASRSQNTDAEVREPEITMQNTG